MAWLGSALLFMPNMEKTITPIKKIENGLQVNGFFINNIYSKYVDAFDKNEVEILDYDYNNVTRVKNIIKSINNKIIRIFFNTPESIYNKYNNINAFTEDQNIKMYDGSLKLGADLKVGDEISGVCGFKSIITKIDVLDINDTCVYDIITESRTFYIQGMMGIF